MPRRAARIASAIFVNILAGIPLVMLAQAEPVTSDNCLTSPKGDTPAGSHWRYRIDHANKRNCWYLRREDGSIAQAVPEPNPRAPQPATKPSLADARAELRPRAAAREDAPTANLPVTGGNPADPAVSQAAAPNNSVWNAPPVATRWPELPPASPIPKTAVAAADTATNTAQPETVAPAAASAAESVPGMPGPIRPAMIPALIVATLGALGFVGAAAIVARRYRKRVRRRKATSARGPIWETTDDDRIVLSDPIEDHRDYRPRFARGVASATVSRRPAPELAQRGPRRARR
ncbi:MAG TPA: hypothetical protein VFL62_13585 [Bradyrhizobium sp.]|uniref:hypothetical protein n=1 Tax=Bradyrhizobium sp. TaxID=376 RepID=UPI002D7E61EA|nr:hypothetical protein [Bradyrhizobium sp.]HET7887255.1 hypothetical protein [Bradyrhizobium sp.]